MEKTKICSKCGEELPLTDEYFQFRKDSKDGFMNQCRKCKGTVRRIKPKAQEGMKICTKCGKELPATNEYFAINKECENSLNSICKECVNSYGKQYYIKNKEQIDEKNKIWRESNKELVSELSKKWHEENKEYHNEINKQYYYANREHLLECSRQYYENNKEHKLESSRIWLQNNKERKKETNREWIKNNIGYYREHKAKYRKENKHILANWYKNNKERVRAYQQKRKAIKNGLVATLTPERWEKIKKDFNYRCAYCGMSEEEHLKEYNQLLHREHFIALTNNGEFTHNNIIPSCITCNSSKSTKDFFEWYPQQPFYSKKREKFILDYLHYTDNGEQQLSIAL